jgi:hypothetical protein
MFANGFANQLPMMDQLEMVQAGTVETKTSSGAGFSATDRDHPG